MNIRKALLYAVLGLCGLILLNLMRASYEAVYGGGIIRLSPDSFAPSIPVLWAVLFGVLIEWRGVLSVVKGRASISWHLTLVVVLLVLSLMPPQWWVIWFRTGGDPLENPILGWLIRPLYHTTISMVLGVLAGILIVRSLTAAMDAPTRTED